MLWGASRIQAPIATARLATPRIRRDTLFGFLTIHDPEVEGKGSGAGTCELRAGPQLDAGVSLVGYDDPEVRSTGDSGLLVYRCRCNVIGRWASDIRQDVRARIPNTTARELDLDRRSRGRSAVEVERDFVDVRWVRGVQTVMNVAHRVSGDSPGAVPRL